MKKVSIIMHDINRGKNIDKLKEMGLLHVEKTDIPSDEFSMQLDQRALIERALSFLPQEKKEKKGSKIHEYSGKVSVDTAISYAKRIIQQSEEQKSQEELYKKLNQYIEDINIWGDFSPDELNDVKKSGVDFILGSIKKKFLKDFKSLYTVFILGQDKQNIYTAVIKNNNELPEYFIPYSVPEKSLSDYENEAVNIQYEIDKINTEISSLIRHKIFLQHSLEYIIDCIDFTAVCDSVESDEELSVISGFTPTYKIPEIEEFCRKSGWAVFHRDPLKTEEVPTLIQNKRAISIIKPVFSLLDTKPGFRENDISFLFLIFFSLFFAMIIGDAGYGCIIFIGSLISIVKSTAKKKPVSDVSFLMALLGITTIIWGAVTGSWFGSEAIAGIPAFKAITINEIYAHDPAASDNVKILCFIIGTVHISLAHLWNIIRGIRQKEGLKIIAQFGWLFFVISLYFVLLNLVISSDKYPVPAYIFPAILGSFSLIVFFSQQEGHFFKGILNGFKGLLTTTLDAIGSFSDIISYLRLFAVGLASIAIAKSFNAMAASLSDSSDSMLGIIGGALIIILGHSLNLIMGALSVIVHGVRLNMLEFSGHLEMEWSGFDYKPFCKKQKRI